MMQFLLSVQSRVSPTWSPSLAHVTCHPLHHLGVVAAHHPAHVVTQPVVTEELLLHVDALALELAVEGLPPGHAGLLLTHEHRGLLEVGAVPIFLTSLQKPLIDLLKHAVTKFITISTPRPCSPPLGCRMWCAPPAPCRQRGTRCPGYWNSPPISVQTHSF